MKLSPSLAPIFWSYDLQALDSETHKRLIISQILNYGTIESLRWLKKTYTPDDIREVIAQSSKSAWSLKSLRLFTTLYNTEPKQSKRGALV